MAYDALERISAVIKEARQIRTDECVYNKAERDDENRYTNDAPAAFKQNKHTDYSDSNVERCIASCSAHDCLEVDDDIHPACCANYSKNNVVQRKRVARHFFCCRKQNECKQLNKRKMRCAEKLRCNCSRQSCIQLEQTERHGDNNCDVLPPALVFTVCLFAVKLLHKLFHFVFVCRWKNIFYFWCFVFLFC